MFRRDQFGLIFNTLFSILFGFSLTAFSQVMQGVATPEKLFTGFIVAFAINFTLGSYIPLVKVGGAFASRFVKDENSLPFNLLRILAIVFIMTACMSFLMMLVEMGFSPELLPAFIFSFPLTFVFAYVVAVICFPLLLKLTQNLCVK